jgi:FMN phosphatase YigB (HAD superfamily)
MIKDSKVVFFDMGNTLLHFHSNFLKGFDYKIKFEDGIQ